MARAPVTRVEVPAGWQEAASAVHRRLKKSTFDVYLNPDGVVWMRPIYRHYVSVLPDAWLVGRYAPATKIEDIEGDMLARMKELSADAFSKWEAA